MSQYVVALEIVELEISALSQLRDVDNLSRVQGKMLDDMKDGLQSSRVESLDFTRFEQSPHWK